MKLVVAEYDAAASIFLTHEQNVNFNLTPVLAAVTLPPLLPTPRPYLHRCCAERAHEGTHIRVADRTTVLSAAPARTARPVSIDRPPFLGMDFCAALQRGPSASQYSSIPSVSVVRCIPLRTWHLLIPLGWQRTKVLLNEDPLTPATTAQVELRCGAVWRWRCGAVCDGPTAEDGDGARHSPVPKAS